MEFKPIKTLPNACPLFVKDAYDALVENNVFAWHWHEPMTASELERFLIVGSSRENRGDFFDIRVTHGLYSKLSIFDHVICFKMTCAPFLLTMPYGTVDEFTREFTAFLEAYYQEKAYVAETVTRFRREMYLSETWDFQLNFKPKMMAAIIPNRFKVRENGDFAAVIAMSNNIRAIDISFGALKFIGHGVGYD